MDVDAVWADYNGGFGSHTNADDAMGYYRDKPPGGEDSLSFAYIYDFDGTVESKTIKISFDVKRFEHSNVNYNDINPVGCEPLETIEPLVFKVNISNAVSSLGFDEGEDFIDFRPGNSARYNFKTSYNVSYGDSVKLDLLR